MSMAGGGSEAQTPTHGGRGYPSRAGVEHGFTRQHKEERATRVSRERSARGGADYRTRWTRRERGAACVCLLESSTRHSAGREKQKLKYNNSDCGSRMLGHPW